MTECKGIIFDMDGVIIDSEPLHAKAHIEALRELGIELDPNYVYEHFIGCTPKAVMNDLKEKYHLNLSIKEMEALNKRYLRKIYKEEGYPPIPHTKELLESIKEAGLLTALASSSPPSRVHQVLKSLGLASYFDVVLGGTDAARSKPAPDIFLEAAKKLSLSPNECVVIEDSHNGVLAGVAAGMTVIGFLNPHSGNQDLRKADVLIDSFSNIDAAFLIREFNRHNGIPITIAVTKRLFIRELTADDLPAITDLYDEPGIEDVVDPLPKEEEERSHWHRAYIKEVYGFYGYGLWGVYLRENNRLIGLCGFTQEMIEDQPEMELSYLIHRDFRRRGYALEALNAVMAFGRQELSLDRFVALILPYNLPSIRLAERVGMTREKSVTVRERKYDLYVIDDRRTAAARQVKDMLSFSSPSYRILYPERVEKERSAHPSKISNTGHRRKESVVND